MGFKLGDLHAVPDTGKQRANPDGALRFIHIRNGLKRLQREADHLLLEARRGEHTESIPYLETVVEATAQARRNFR